jgi:pimeloyl-ACP methyl ester carboxylesterase
MTLKYDRYGVGKKTIFLIHGGPSLTGYMRTLGNLLAQDFQVVEPFQRGTKENPETDPTKLTLETHISDLKELISQFEDPILIGHSWGAVLSLLFLSVHPGMVKKCVLISTGVMNHEIGQQFSHNLMSRLSDKNKPRHEKINIKMKTTEDPVLLNKYMLERLKLLGPSYHHDPETESLMPAISWVFASFLVTNNSIWELIDADEFVPQLTKIKDPVVALHGTSDPIPADKVFSVLKNIPKIQLKLIPDSGHFPWIETKVRDTFIELLVGELR